MHSVYSCFLLQGEEIKVVGSCIWFHYDGEGFLAVAAFCSACMVLVVSMQQFGCFLHSVSFQLSVLVSFNQIVTHGFSYG